MAQLTRRAGVLALLVAALLQPSRGGVQVSDTQPPDRTLKGKIRLTPPQGRPFKDADLIVTVENIAAHDAPSRRVGQLRRKHVSYDGRRDSVLEFTMEGLRPPPGSNCRVRVLVDVDRNGRISVGDYRTTKATAVFTGKEPNPLVVEVDVEVELKKE